MKPERLELAGFTAYREKTVVDFTDLELFALTGPTGAGKSSLIDAITFALYGAVPRQSGVEPVISSNMNEARVRFDFELDGRQLTAVRVARRSATGATTSEARLEEIDGEVIASGATQMTEAVTKLIGLSFSHFTRSVVLPQGEFARLLHDKPADRQAFLKELLDLGVLERVRELGKRRMQKVRDESEIRTERLRALEHATPEAEKLTEEKEQRLATLVESVRKMSAGLSDIEAQIEKHQKTLEGLGEDRDLLAEIEAPTGLDSLSDDLKTTELELEAAEQAESLARATLEQARTHRFELPKTTDLERMEAQSKRLSELTQQLEELHDPSAEHTEAENKVTESKAVMAERTSEYETLKVSHAAAALLGGVMVGDACPVCHRSLEEMPSHSGQEDVDRAHEALNTAQADLEIQRKRRDEIALAVQRYESNRTTLQETIGALKDEIDKAPADLEGLRQTIEAAEESVKKAENECSAAEQAHVKAKSQRTQVLERSRDVRSAFDRRRFSLARLDPPEPEGDDPKVNWSQITEWAATKRQALEAEMAERSEDLSSLTRDLGEKRTAIAELFGAEELVPGDDPAVTAVRAHQSAVNQLEKIKEERREAEKIQQTLISLEREAQLCKTLIDHLRANRFEGWLLEEALYELVDGANHLLGELSSGNFSLDVEDRAFTVIDHRNLEARRGVRTLSGGETFLVSLALALSLASQLAEMSTEGMARLDAIFLDEGFGSLDAESLETVASVVTELSSKGRVVGLVTHVTELAEQMPVRFVVTRDSTGARVERQDQ